jgi:hypothetical protein
MNYVDYHQRVTESLGTRGAWWYPMSILDLRWRPELKCALVYGLKTVHSAAYWKEAGAVKKRETGV